MSYNKLADWNKKSKLLGILLKCGIVAPFLFVITDLIAGMMWGGYSVINQSISELSAIGAPTRLLVVPLNVLYNLILLAFIFGIYGSANKNRTLKFTALMMFGNVTFTLIAIFFPIYLNELNIFTNNPTGLIFLELGVFCFLFAILSGAIAFNNWFRFYSLGTILTYLALTILGLSQSTPHVGAQERIMVYGYLLWVIGLAITLLKNKN